MSILGTIAAVVTGFFTAWNPQAMAAAYSIGSGVESALNPPTNNGPRLEDLRVQMSNYGAPIPFEWGVNRHAGTIMWPQTLDAVEHKHEESSKKSETVTYTYTLTCAVLVCEGPIAGIRRIWANKKIVYDVSADNAGATQDPAIGSIRFYLGTETQDADPLIEATDGPSPAYRGSAYVVFEDYDVTDLGGRPPQWEFEVVTDAQIEPFTPTAKGFSSGAIQVARDPATGYLWCATGYNYIEIFDPVTETHIYPDGSPVTGAHSISLSQVFLPITNTYVSPNTLSIAYSTISHSFYVAGGEGAVYIVDPSGGVSLLSDDVFSKMVPLPPPDHGMYCVPDVIHRQLGYKAVMVSGNEVTGITANELIQTVNWSLGGNILGPVTYDCSGDSVIGRVDAALASPMYGDYYLSEVATNPNNTFSIGLFDQSGNIREMPGGSLLYQMPTDSTNVSWDSKRNLFWAVNHNGTSYSLYSVTPGGAEFVGLLPITGYQAFCYVAATDTLMFATRLSVGGADQIRVQEVSIDALTVVSETLSGAILNQTSSIGSSSVSMMDLPDLGKMVAFGPGLVFMPHAQTDRLTPNQVLLSDIVSDICVRADLSTDDIDVTQLTDLVDGYIVPRQMTARAAIEPLQAAFYFDAVESDDKIKFVKRGGAVAATIPQDERAAHEHGQAMPDALSIVRAFELELPFQCDVEYPDVNADHLIGNQYDRRITKDTKQKINLQLPIVMTAEKAKQIARVSLYQAWLNQSYRWTTTRKYAYLEPTDAVDLPTASALYHARILSKKEMPNGVIEWEGRMEGVEVYAQSGADAAPTNYVPQTVFVADSTVLALLDIPLLRDEDDNAGFYVAMGGSI